MTTYVFEDHKILKSRVLDSSLSETIMYVTTTQGFLHRKETVISDVAQQPLATIHWKTKMFEMGGVSRSTDEMKTKPDTFFDRHWRRIWRWDPSSPEYSVEYRDNKWTVTQSTTGTVCAAFNIYRAYIFRKSKPASLTFTGDLSDSQRLFLMMVLLRMETRRLDTENQANASAAASASAASAGAVAAAVS